MFFLFLFLIFAGVTAALWFQGLWNCATAVINITFAGLIATAYFEPICDMIDANAPGFIYIIDFVVLWGLFMLSYALLRAIADGISKNVSIFHPYVELGGRSVLAAWGGWVFTCFAAFTLQLAPLDPSPLGAWSTPEAKSFLTASPDIQWAAFANDRSRGALSRGKFSPDAKSHPEDGDVEAFDPLGEFAFRAHDRRRRYTALDGMRIQ